VELAVDDHNAPHTLTVTGVWGGAVVDAEALIVRRPPHHSRKLRVDVYVGSDRPSVALPATTFRVRLALRRSSSATDLTVTVSPSSAEPLHAPA
jgi:hypothetical protein